MPKRNRLKPREPVAVHPGAVLGEILEGNGLTQSDLAKHLKMPQSKVNEICRGKRGISVEMAYSLARTFRSTPEFWMNLQKNWEMKQVDEHDFDDVGPIKLRA